jgi:hypothetical protein
LTCVSSPYRLADGVYEIVSACELVQYILVNEYGVPGRQRIVTRLVLWCRKIKRVIFLVQVYRLLFDFLDFSKWLQLIRSKIFLLRNMKVIYDLRHDLCSVFSELPDVLKQFLAHGNSLLFVEVGLNYIAPVILELEVPSLRLLVLLLSLQLHLIFEVLVHIVFDLTDLIAIHHSFFFLFFATLLLFVCIVDVHVLLKDLFGALNLGRLSLK